MDIEKIIAGIPNADRKKRETMRHNALEKIEEGDPKWIAPAEKLLTALDQQEASEQAELVAEMKGLEPAERVLQAFTREPATDNEAKLIQVLLDNPGSTSAELTEKIGWKAQSWHLHFGTMCANRGVFLGPPPGSSVSSGKFYSGILADFDQNGSLFTMKPDVALAFESIGFRPAR